MALLPVFFGLTEATTTLFAMSDDHQSPRDPEVVGWLHVSRFFRAVDIVRVHTPARISSPIGISVAVLLSPGCTPCHVSKTYALRILLIRDKVTDATSEVGVYSRRQSKLRSCLSRFSCCAKAGQGFPRVIFTTIRTSLCLHQHLRPSRQSNSDTLSVHFCAVCPSLRSHSPLALWPFLRW